MYCSKLKTSLQSIMLTGVLLLTMNAFSQDNPELSDAEIAHVVVVANQIDVDYGKLALKKNPDAAAKKFANTMIQDHENIINQASALAEKLSVDPKDNAVSKSLLDQQKEVVKKLNSLKGEKFSTAYIDNEVDYHKAVIDAVKNLLIPQTENEEFKQALTDVMPLLEHHLEMAKTVQKNLD